MYVVKDEYCLEKDSAINIYYCQMHTFISEMPYK